MSSLARPRLRGVVQTPSVAAVMSLLRIVLVAPRNVVVRACGGGLNVPGEPLRPRKNVSPDKEGTEIVSVIKDPSGSGKGAMQKSRKLIETWIQRVCNEVIFHLLSKTPSC